MTSDVVFGKSLVLFSLVAVVFLFPFSLLLFKQLESICHLRVTYGKYVTRVLDVESWMYVVTDSTSSSDPSKTFVHIITRSLHGNSGIWIFVIVASATSYSFGSLTSEIVLATGR